MLCNSTPSPHSVRLPPPPQQALAGVKAAHCPQSGNCATTRTANIAAPGVDPILGYKYLSYVELAVERPAYTFRWQRDVTVVLLIRANGVTHAESRFKL
jgi:hypothetical protein